MLVLQESEIEFVKILLLGFFLGWTSRKYLKGHGRHTPWTVIKNMKYPFMNLKPAKIKVELLMKEKN